MNKTEIISYWHPNLTLNLVYDQTPWPRGSLPVPMNECKYSAISFTNFKCIMNSETFV